MSPPLLLTLVVIGLMLLCLGCGGAVLAARSLGRRRIERSLHGSAPGTATTASDGLRLSADVRALRLQVRSLTETLEALALERVSDPGVPPATSVTWQDGPEHCSYTTLSRELVRQGRVHEAVLAQWASDLRVLRPVLGDRTDAVCEGLSTVETTTDAGAVLSQARSLALGQVPEGTPPVTFAPAAHLHGWPMTPPRAPQHEALGWAEGLPTELVAAFDATVSSAAMTAGDDGNVSCELRRDLVRHLRGRGVGLSTPSPTELLRAALEPHELATFDLELSRRAQCLH